MMLSQQLRGNYGQANRSQGHRGEDGRGRRQASSLHGVLRAQDPIADQDEDERQADQQLHHRGSMVARCVMIKSMVSIPLDLRVDVMDAVDFGPERGVQYLVNCTEAEEMFWVTPHQLEGLEMLVEAWEGPPR